MGIFPSGIDVNQVTNKIYVSNSGEGTVSIIDGFTLTVIDTVNLAFGTTPGVVGVNTVTNEIYVANGGRKTLSVLSGRSTGTGLTCNPSTLSLSASTTCTAAVSDLSGSGASTPTALVFFSSSGQGNFSSANCILVGSGTTASCSTSFKPTAFGSGHQTIYATYSGDTAHMSSSANTVVTLNDASVGGTLIPIYSHYSIVLLSTMFII